MTATPEDEDVRQTEDEAAEGDSSATPTIYQRGPVSLPQPPLPHNRALIRPMAKRLVTIDVITTTSYDNVGNQKRN